MYKDFKKSESLDTGFVGGGGILWMFSGIILGLVVGIGMYYFSNDNSPSMSMIDTVQQKIEKAQSSKTMSSYKKKNRRQEDLNEKQPRENKFSYHAVLPNIGVPVGAMKPIETRAEVIANESEVDKKIALLNAESEKEEKAKPTKPGDYLLQVASFKRKSMANKTRGRLSNKGIDAYVQKKKVKGHFWYRVVAGPVDQTSVDNWKLTAEKLGHQPLVISVR